MPREEARLSGDRDNDLCGKRPLSPGKMDFNSLI